MLADEVDYVIGVDTHRDQHTLAIVAAPSGALVAQRSVRADGRGSRQAVRFADEHAPGVRVWAIEGAAHYGAGLARYLARRQQRLHEVSRTSRGERRLRGKDDSLDAAQLTHARTARDDPRSPHHSRAGSRPRPKKRTTSSARSSPTSAPACPNCSMNQALARSSPPS